MARSGWTESGIGFGPNQTACSVNEATAPAEIAQVRLALLSLCVVAGIISILLAAQSRFSGQARAGIEFGCMLFCVVGTVASPAVAILALLAGSMLSIVAEILLVLVLVRLAKANRSRRAFLCFVCCCYCVVGTVATPLDEIISIATQNTAWQTLTQKPACERVCPPHSPTKRRDH